MSIGFFVEQDAAVVWRGPMLHKALQQFLEDVEWGELDYLLIDLPPGTGDVSMTLAQLLPQAKFLIVTTPQPVAQKVARRSAEMATKLKLEIAGVIENMSGFVTPTGERYQIFGEGGGQLLAEELEVPLLGQGAADDGAARAVRRRRADRVLGPRRSRRAGDRATRARGLIALSPIELPVMQAPAPAAAPEAGRHVAADGLKGAGAARRLALVRVVVRVELDVLLPLVGQLVLGEAGVDRAGLDAGIAVDALFRVDVEHLDVVVVGLVGGRMDAVDRADLHARVVLGADAGLGDHVGHKVSYSLGSGVVQTRFYGRRALPVSRE